MRENRLKAMIKEGKAAFGSWVTLSDVSVIELMGLAGYDFAIIDIEHAPLDYQTVENMIRGAEMIGITPLVRVGQNQENTILRVMESGAHGVIVPHVKNREEAVRAVQAAKYEPIGIRGISAVTRAARWATMDFGVHVKTSNEQTMVIPMIEDIEGVEKIEEIVTMEGVDLVLIGPADLARAYGVTSEKDPPAVKDAVDRIAAAARKAGKPIGLSIFHAAFNRGYRDLFDLGVRFITQSSDAAMLVRGMKESLKKAKES